MLVEKLKAIDQHLFLTINGLHHPLFDFLFFGISKEWIWLPLYLWVAYQFYLKYPQTFWKLIGLGILLVVITDQTSAHLIKNFFKRYRPTHHLVIGHLTHPVNNYKGGLYGFVSSHAANTMGFAIYAGLRLKKQMPRLLPILIGWSLTVCYSRIYLGVHYPTDIMGGIIIGIVAGYLSFALSKSKILN